MVTAYEDLEIVRPLGSRWDPIVWRI